MSEFIQHVTDAQFDQQILRSDLPVLVDYWAEWCAPCKSMEPLLDEIARTYQGKLVVAKVDTVKNPQSPRKYGVRGLPTLMIFKNGQIRDTRIGAMGKSQLTQFIDGALKA